MAKIILSMGETVLREVVLSKGRVTIGRRRHNDIVIEDVAVSGEHAVIVTSGSDSYLEDLNSTNGTQVNGQPVRTHFLQDNDIVDLAQYRMTYLADKRADTSCTPHAKETTDIYIPGIRRGARVKILNGSEAGKETLLAKAMTTVGHPSADIAVIIRQPQGYALTHLEGVGRPLVNGVVIGVDAHHLRHGDVIDLARTQLQFLEH